MTNTHPTPKIIVRGLRKSFGRKPVINDLELDCGSGESLVTFLVILIGTGGGGFAGSGFLLREGFLEPLPTHFVGDDPFAVRMIRVLF